MRLWKIKPEQDLGLFLGAFTLRAIQELLLNMVLLFRIKGHLKQSFTLATSIATLVRITKLTVFSLKLFGVFAKQTTNYVSVK